LEPDRKRPIGRPRQRLSDRVKKDLKFLGIKDGKREHWIKRYSGSDWSKWPGIKHKKEFKK